MEKSKKKRTHAQAFPYSDQFPQQKLEAQTLVNFAGNTYQQTEYSESDNTLVQSPAKKRFTSFFQPEFKQFGQAESLLKPQQKLIGDPKVIYETE